MDLVPALLSVVEKGSPEPPPKGKEERELKVFIYTSDCGVAI